MKKNRKKLNLNLVLLLIIFMMFFSVVKVFALEREITITTYYPTPYGEYTRTDIQTIQGRSGSIGKVFDYGDFTDPPADWRVEGLNVDFLDGFSAEEFLLNANKSDYESSACRDVLMYNLSLDSPDDIPLAEQYIWGGGCSSYSEFVNGVTVINADAGFHNFGAGWLHCCEAITGKAD